ncbi:hypothetical protein [Chitinolyticbacter meiyuanensis]|uniref:hypothetical protein n=1 Tax=Chitinolyticbacter meiyuanensis TaxID=682798 RepID=UPI0011E601EF|nr:hypothetical protein [Chitinolyticbacter meiyuanensis]
MKRQAGAALLALLLMLVLAFATLWLAQPWQARLAASASAHNADVLGEAKRALLAWSALHCTQPGANLANVVAGELPRPDTDAPGTAGAGSQNVIGAPRLGRLPWRTLAIPPLRDASGEVLWYAIRNEYGDNGDNPPDPCLSLTVRDAAGARLDAAPARCIIALVLAPGAARPGQDRSDPLNAAAYLDATTVGGHAVDNAAANGPFVLGPVDDGHDVNDQVLAITWQELRLPSSNRPCVLPTP